MINGWKSRLRAGAVFPMILPMQSQPHRGRKWRRFVRHNRNRFFVGFFLLIILALVAVMFWVMTSPRFLMGR